MDFKIIQDNKEINCEVLFTFNENNINYIVYTDGTKDENNELEVYASRYKLKDNQYFLEEIEREEEWDLIDDMLNIRLNGIGDTDEEI